MGGGGYSLRRRFRGRARGPSRGGPPLFLEPTSGLQIASGVIQAALDPFDEVDGLRPAAQPNSAISFADRMPFVATLAKCLVII
jgi:hypothetical protein